MWLLFLFVVVSAHNTCEDLTHCCFGKHDYWTHGECQINSTLPTPILRPKYLKLKEQLRDAVDLDPFDCELNPVSFHGLNISAPPQTIQIIRVQSEYPVHSTPDTEIHYTRTTFKLFLEVKVSKVKEMVEVIGVSDLQFTVSNRIAVSDYSTAVGLTFNSTVIDTIQLNAYLPGLLNNYFNQLQFTPLSKSESTLALEIQDRVRAILSGGLKCDTTITSANQATNKRIPYDSLIVDGLFNVPRSLIEVATSNGYICDIFKSGCGYTISYSFNILNVTGLAQFLPAEVVDYRFIIGPDPKITTVFLYTIRLTIPRNLVTLFSTVSVSMYDSATGKNTVPYGPFYNTNPTKDLIMDISGQIVATPPNPPGIVRFTSNSIFLYTYKNQPLLPGIQSNGNSRLLGPLNTINAGNINMLSSQLFSQSNPTFMGCLANTLTSFVTPSNPILYPV